MKTTKLLMMAAAMALSCSMAHAYDFMDANGIAYKVNADSVTVSVTYTGSSKWDNSYPGVTEVVIPATVTNNTLTYTVTEIGPNAFYSATELANVVIPETITAIRAYAFYNCTSLVEFTIPNRCETLGEYAFSYCTNLSTMTVPATVANLGSGILAGCTGLTSVDLPNNMVYIPSYMFNGCTNLPEVQIPANLQNIGEYAFANCQSITQMAIPETVTSIGAGAFSECSSLVRVNLPKKLTTVASKLFSFCSHLRSIEFGDKITSIESQAFEYCTTLTQLTFPNSLKSIGYEAFNCCRSVERIDMGNAVTSIESFAFTQTAIEEITLPNTLIELGGAFNDCRNLKAVHNLENTRIKQISPFTFDGCGNLHEIVLPNTVTSIYGGFTRSGLESIVIPNSVTGIYGGGNYSAFTGCSQLKSVYIGRNVKEIYNTTYQGANSLNQSYNIFGSCPALETFVVDPDNVFFDSRDNSNALIDTYTNSLLLATNNTKIPKTIKSIRIQAINSANQLERITIPASVNYIEGQAITANKLKHVRCEITDLESVSIDGNGFFPWNYKTLKPVLTVPGHVLEDYKAHPSFSNFHKILPIGDLTGEELIDVADVDVLIDVVLGKKTAYEVLGDVDINDDGIVDVSDVDVLIDMVLGK